MAAYREVVCTDNLAVCIKHVAGRHLRLVLRVGDDLLGKTCRLVGLSTVCDALDNVVEAERTCVLCNDNGVERVPLSDEVALLHNVAILEVERRTVRHVDRSECDVGIRVDELQLCKTAHYHLAVDVLLAVVLYERNDTEVLKLKLAVVLCCDRSVGCCVTSHTTGVEGTESKLCTRLTDSLSCDDTDSLAELYHALCSEVAAVTLHADALLALASEHRTNLYALDWRVLDELCLSLCDLLASIDDNLASARVDNVVY